MSNVVAHFVRGFLRPTETFIGNQISTLNEFIPKVFCHHTINGHSYENITPIEILTNLSPKQRSIQTYVYKYFRMLSPSAIQYLVSAVRKENAKILHFHYLVDARFFLPVAMRLKLPTVVSGYGWDVSLFPKMKFGYGKYYLKPLFTYMDLFLAMSDDMKRDMMTLGCPENKILVHYYGSDTARFSFPDRVYHSNEPLKILYCGRLAPKKAPHLILYALKIIEERYSDMPKWNLTIVGDGLLRETLLSMVRKYQWEEKVLFTGHIPHHDKRLVDVYKNADIYIQPSLTANGEKEGIPGTLVEAMASGLPCISTYHAGIPSVIEDGVNGLLCHEGNVDEIADKLWLLMVDVSLRERLGKNAAMKAARELNLYERTKNLEKIYHKLLTTKFIY